MRRSFLSGLALFVAGCSLLVDTSGLTGGPGPDAGSDAAVITVETATDATPEPDAGSAVEDAAPRVDADTAAGADAGTDATLVDPIAAALVAEWKFEDDTTTAAMDATGHGHNGIVTNGKHVAGKYGQAIDSSGNQASIAIPATHDFDRPAGKAFSITAWVKLGFTTPDHSFVLAVGYGASQYGLEIRDSTHFNYYAGDLPGGADGHVATSQVNFAGAWSHVATVVAATSVKTYFNGTPVGGGTVDGPASTASSLTLGAFRLGAALDNVRFYDRALSDAEIVTEAAR